MQCSGCGWDAPDGGPSCQELIGELLARDFEDRAFWPYHRKLVDTYALQHPDEYCVSAKSLAAHLCGLCIAMEDSAGAGAFDALQRWLNGPSPIEKPALPQERGAVTISQVRGESDVNSYAAALDRWARSTWRAHASLQPLARQWLRATRS